MKVSSFGQKIAATSGIGQLMEDLDGDLTQSRYIRSKGDLRNCPRVLRMHRKDISLGDIAIVTGITKPNVWYWIKKYGDEIV